MYIVEVSAIYYKSELTNNPPGAQLCRLRTDPVSVGAG